MQQFKQDMMQHYQISDLGLTNYFLGIEALKLKKKLISKNKYTKSIV